MTSEHYDRTREQLVDAILSRVRDARPEDLLRFITDRDLERSSGVSAGTVRRMFARHPGTEQLDRGRMFVAVVERMISDLDATHRVSAARWVDVAQRLEQGEGLMVILEAISADLGSFVPAGDPLVDARERTLRLALAIADGDDLASREVAQLLRTHFERHYARYRQACDAMLRATRRRLADGTEPEDLIRVADAVLSLHVNSARIGTLIAPDQVLATLARIATGYTRRADDPSPDLNPINDVLGPLLARPDGSDGRTDRR